MGEQVEIVVRGVPTVMYLAARRQVDRLLDGADRLRELVGDGRPEVEAVVAAAAILADPGRARSTEQVRTAHERGEETVDLTITADHASAIRLLVRGMDLLEAADRYSRMGALPAPPADPDVRAFWRWFGRSVDQALAEAGHPPHS